MSHPVTKPTIWHLRPAKTQISLGIRPVWSESSLSTWRKLRSLATHWGHSEGSDQTGRMPRLIWVFAGRTCHFVGFVMRWLTLQYYCLNAVMSRSMTKLTKWPVHQLKTQISRDIRPVWSESLLCAFWVAKDSNFLSADSKDWSD